jgi:cytochrome c biogenesis protein CcdA
MEIVEPIRFGVGIVLLIVGAAFLWQARGTRGFGQKRQTGAVMLAGGALLVALGLGLIDFGGGVLT